MFIKCQKNSQRRVNFRPKQTERFPLLQYLYNLSGIIDIKWCDHYIHIYYYNCICMNLIPIIIIPLLDYMAFTQRHMDIQNVCLCVDLHLMLT